MIPKNRIELSDKIREVERRKVTKLLYSLQTFNLLNKRIVSLVSESFGVDAKEICEQNGIIYFL